MAQRAVKRGHCSCSAVLCLTTAESVGVYTREPAAARFLRSVQFASDVQRAHPFHRGRVLPEKGCGLQQRGGR